MPAPLLEQNVLPYVTELASRLPLEYARRLNKWAGEIRLCTDNFADESLPSRQRVGTAISTIEEMTGKVLQRQQQHPAAL
mmetsp:Transcript_7983/g.24694  ORF Transcript_7983/g.24694 Transcript_7983/m.24694 type:complete len:80 (-) Transcript_7983:5521-5760(-)